MSHGWSGVECCFCHNAQRSVGQADTTSGRKAKLTKMLTKKLSDKDKDVDIDEQRGPTG